MASGSDSRPRHEQVAADLRSRIMSGELPPGSALPSIPTLVRQYSAATATVQRALGALKAEGSVYSEVGKGVYVRPRRPLVVEASAYLAPTSDGYAYRLRSVAEVVPPAEVARELEIGADERAVLRHRLLVCGDEPVELSWSYYPAAIASGTELAERRKIPGGAPRALADLGYPQRHTRDRVCARMPTTEEVEALDLPPYVPVLRQLRVIRSVDARPVEVSILVKGSHRHELHYDQRG
ncbi:GntR family transcriptional regulator [Salinispora tropica]|uniref:Transcriptional regulator, GntR family n=1 Tax=Salinispora tropica (strain ATCC BAA-916 / DSM 44818 / JCM 13857 / NBRC 105044 / CNB-440) TaxID=369723 RepID=A4X180_SALTO|nr:GntR family transcriptional regulator [Salinispora tropica]ABP52630.1 transcriptional regulator, GntR family [Salinispora tropica CNB-440]